MTTSTHTPLTFVSDVICEQYGPLAVHHTKSQIERAAQTAQALGQSPNEACPHPFHSKCGMHWLAAFNLATPLPATYMNTSEVEA